MIHVQEYSGTLCGHISSKYFFWQGLSIKKENVTYGNKLKSKTDNKTASRNMKIHSNFSLLLLDFFFIKTHTCTDTYTQIK